MDSSNKNFESFDDNQTDLPEGFGWEDMKDGVYEKMPAQKKRRRLAAWWWFGAAGLIFLALGAWGYISYLDLPSSELVIEKVGNQQKDIVKSNENTHQDVVSNIDLKTIPKAEESKELTITESFASSSVQKVVRTQSTINISSEIYSGASFKSFDKKVSNINSQKTHNEYSNNNETYIVIGTEKNEQIDESSRGDLISTHFVNDKKSMVTEASKAPQPHSQQSLHSTSLVALATPLLQLFETPRGLILQETSNPLSQKQKKSNLLKSDFLILEGVSAFALTNKALVNTPYLSSWYGYGASIGYQKQIGKRFGLSAHYNFSQVKQEFSFSNRDTTRGINFVDHTTEFRDVNTLALLSSSTTSAEEQLDRQRDVLSYNTFNVHQLSLFAHYTRPLSTDGSIDIGVGGGVQYLGSADGFRLDENLEVIDLSTAFQSKDKLSSSLSARLRYLHLLSPKLQLSAGMDYNHSMKGVIPNVVSGTVGVRMKL